MNKLQAYLHAWLSGKTEPPVTKLVGIELREAGDGAAIVQLQTGTRHHNPMGTVHGGILCDLADAGMGVAMASALNENETFATVTLNIQYFKAVKDSLLTARAQIVRRGGNIAHLECEVLDEMEHLVARASSVCLIQSLSQ